MKNFEVGEGVVKLRKGNKKFAQTSGASPYGQVLNIAAYGSTNLFMLVDLSGLSAMTWFDVTSGTPSSVHTVAGGGDDEIHTLYFNGYLFYFGEFELSPSQSGPQYYNGTTWGAAGYTWSINAPLGGCVYKNRAYILDSSTAKYAYTAIDAISGATTTVDLGSVISEKATMAAIRAVSLSENVTQEAVLAFLFTSGQILVYGGSYPDSATWGLISRARTAPLIYINAAIDAKGDTFLLTKTEILSLRNVIAKGYDVERRDGIGAAIANRWRQIVSSTTINYFTRGFYDDIRDRLVISFSDYVNPDTSATESGIFQLIYDFSLGAWYEYFQPASDTSATYMMATSACFFNGVSYVLSSTIVSSTEYATVHKLDTETNFLDDKIVSGEAGIDFDLVTAPLPIQKFGANAIDGVEVICQTDLYPQTNYKFIADLGRQETNEQNLPSQGTDIAKPMMNVGIQGAITTQLEISGTSVSSSLGLELHALNIWYTPGASTSR
jgi:hypothetical protein